VRVRFHPGATADLASAGDWYEFQLTGLGTDLVREGEVVVLAIAHLRRRPGYWSRRLSEEE
jgi:hypothetical protein